MDDLETLIDASAKLAPMVFRAVGGNFYPMWHAFTSAGRQIITPSPSADTETSLGLLKALFLEEDVVAYIHIAKALIADVTEEPRLEELTREGLKNYPSAKSVLLITAVSHERALIAHMDINGLELGPLIVEKDITELQGAIYSLLPVKGTRQ